MGAGHAIPAETISAHLIMLTVAWCGLANIGLIAIMFKHSRVAFYIHSICMGIVVVCSFVGPLLLITH